MSLLLRVSPTAKIVAPPVRKTTVVNKSKACEKQFAVHSLELGHATCQLVKNRHFTNYLIQGPKVSAFGAVGVIAFHEKGGGSQGVCAGFRRRCPAEWPLTPCFHSHSRGAIHSLGAGWAFSIQPVLPSDYRPAILPEGRT